MRKIVTQIAKDKRLNADNEQSIDDYTCDEYVKNG